jgi:hypothetical protein
LEGKDVAKRAAGKAGGTTIVYVRWFDSAIYKGEACHPDLLGGACENESAGVLVREDDDSITIALDRCLDTGDVRLVLCVPRANVLSVRRFRASPISSSGAPSSSPATGRRRQPS